MAAKRATTGTGKAYSNKPAKTTRGGQPDSYKGHRSTSRPKAGFKLVKDARAMGAEGPKKSSPAKKAAARKKSR